MGTVLPKTMKDRVANFLPKLAVNYMGHIGTEKSNAYDGLKTVILAFRETNSSQVSSNLASEA